MTIPQKLFFCFLFSPFLFAGITILVFTGILDYPAITEMRVLMFATILLTLFLIISFCFNLSNKIISRQGEPEEVIYENEGIHYINSDIFSENKNTAGKLDNNFAELVESVVNKS